jgi:hypothetical protein
MKATEAIQIVMTHEDEINDILSENKGDDYADAAKEIVMLLVDKLVAFDVEESE